MLVPSTNIQGLNQARGSWANILVAETDLPSKKKKNYTIRKLCIGKKGGKNSLRKQIKGTSLVVQWLRIRLPMQGTRVQSLVWELRSHMPQDN